MAPTRHTRSPKASAVPVPETELLADALPRIDWSDAYAVPCAPGAPRDPQVGAGAVFGRPPRWVVAMLVAREALVGLVGIKRAATRGLG